jgi:integrin alpha FG-GAP repeat containing protein 1
LTFADVDNDGNIDIMLPIFTEHDSANEIHIYYNQAQQLCGSAFDAGDGGCRPTANLCAPDDAFYFDFMSYTAASQAPPRNSANLVIYHFPTGMIGGHMFQAAHPPDAHNPATGAPFQLRLGDINLDGYPDLLLALTPTPAENVEYGVVELWFNVPCPSGSGSGAGPQPHEEGIMCAAEAQGHGRRVFSAHNDEANNVLSSVPGAFAGAAFFDIGDNGEMDIIFSALAPNGPDAGTYSTHAFVNNFNEDAYFLTTIASNGVCPAWCASEPRFPTPKAYGVNMPGATFKFAYTDLSGSQHMSIGAQLPQSGYLAWSPPYCTFGLGRTNTFIDTFFFGIGLNATVHSRSWVSVVPNAQIIIFPYPHDQPDEWTLELFVSPTSHLFWVCISWASLLTVLVLVIGYLHLQEKREDEKEKRKHQLLFTF